MPAERPLAERRPDLAVRAGRPALHVRRRLLRLRHAPPRSSRRRAPSARSAPSRRSSSAWRCARRGYHVFAAGYPAAPAAAPPCRDCSPASRRRCRCRPTARSCTRFERARPPAAADPAAGHRAALAARARRAARGALPRRSRRCSRTAGWRGSARRWASRYAAEDGAGARRRCAQPSRPTAWRWCSVEAGGGDAPRGRCRQGRPAGALRARRRRGSRRGRGRGAAGRLEARGAERARVPARVPRPPAARSRRELRELRRRRPRRGRRRGARRGAQPVPAARRGGRSWPTCAPTPWPPWSSLDDGAAGAWSALAGASRPLPGQRRRRPHRARGRAGGRGALPVAAEPGRAPIERVQEGPFAYRADASTIRGGSLLAADGGFLVVQAQDLLAEPGAWDGAEAHASSTACWRSAARRPAPSACRAPLEPDPVPVDLKVVLDRRALGARRPVRTAIPTSASCSACAPTSPATCRARPPRSAATPRSSPASPPREGLPPVDRRRARARWWRRARRSPTAATA